MRRRTLLRGTALIIGLQLISGCRPVRPARISTGSASECVERRAAFDIGSATTKVKVADVDVCDGGIVEILFADEVPVKYGDDLEHAGASAEFRASTRRHGLEVLRALRDRGQQLGAVSYAAVATSAFRRSDNGSSFAEVIERETGIRVDIISLRQEAVLGFWAAVHDREIDPRTAVVWDVGGGSMELTSYRGDDEYLVYRGELASAGLKAHVMGAIQHKDENARTPNPISAEQAARATAYCETYARAHVPLELRQKLVDPATTVVAIGATKYVVDDAHSQVGSWTVAALEADIARMAGSTDEELGGAYAAGTLSNRILIAGFMHALGIDRVTIADVDLTDGLLVDEARWAAIVSG